MAKVAKIEEKIQFETLNERNFCCSSCTFQVEFENYFPFLTSQIEPKMMNSKIQSHIYAVTQNVMQLVLSIAEACSNLTFSYFQNLHSAVCS